MGVEKEEIEERVKYMEVDIGKKKIRVNEIQDGKIKKIED